MKRLLMVKEVLWALAMFGLVAMVGRFIFGLGAATALSDQVPWGMWKVMNMIAGAALGTSGFIMAFLVVVVRMNIFKPLLRPAILVAFLGYGSSCFALLLDIGLPWRFYYPFIHWNIHSFLFEVALCVTLYFAVTAVEMIPIVTENTRWRKPGHFIHVYVLPIAIVGITLSSLHHTSLGALFLTAPERLHPIWYSPGINWQFILSAMGGGLMMLVLVTLIIGSLYQRRADMRRLGAVAALAAVPLAAYGLMKALDLAARGQWPVVFSGQWEGILFLVESFLLVAAPIAIASVGHWRLRDAGLWVASASTVAGLALNRIDVGIIGFFRSAGAVYVPSLPELCIGFGVPAAAALVFMYVVEHYEVYDAPPFLPKEEPKAIAGETFDPVSGAWGSILSNPLHHISMTAIIAAVAAVGIFSGDALKGMPLLSQRALPPLSHDPTRAVLLINGNRNDMAVAFKHDFHKTRLGGEKSCARCHHLDKPGDLYTTCNKCHADMNLDTQIFNHSHHVEKNGGNAACGKCHTDGNEPRWETNARPCYDCHARDMRMEKPAPGTQSDYNAPSYVDAMHQKCIACHREMDLSHKTNRALEECSTCHGDMRANRPQ
ncbi:MAG: cytochrome c3 family protein [bacterium]